MASKKSKKMMPFMPNKEKVSMEERERLAEAICPTPRCEGNMVHTHKCTNCGATKHVNAVSGNVYWMMNGRLVQGGAFKDERDAYVSMATQWNVPVDQWPERFRP